MVESTGEPARRASTSIASRSPFFALNRVPSAPRSVSLVCRRPRRQNAEVPADRIDHDRRELGDSHLGPADGQFRDAATATRDPGIASDRTVTLVLTPPGVPRFTPSTWTSTVRPRGTASGKTLVTTGTIADVQPVGEVGAAAKLTVANPTAYARSSERQSREWRFPPRACVPTESESTSTGSSFDPTSGTIDLDSDLVPGLRVELEIVDITGPVDCSDDGRREFQSHVPPGLSR